MSETIKIPLTKSKVDRIGLTEGSARREYHDVDLPGFVLRVGSKTKTFYVYRWLNNKPIRVKIGVYGAITPDQARRKAAELIAEMAQGINPNTQKQAARVEGLSLRQALDEYVRINRDLSERSAKDYNEVLARYTGNGGKYSYMNWLDKPIASITRQAFREAYAKLGETAPSGAEHLRSALHVICQFVVDQYDGMALALNPAKIRKEFRFKPATIERHIPAENLPLFIRAVRGLKGDNANIVGNYLLFILLNGLRRNEAARLLWTDVDMDAKSFIVVKPKNRRPHFLPLTRQAYDIIRRRWDGRTNEYVFPGKSGEGPLIDPRKQLTKVIAAMHMELHPGKKLPARSKGFFIEKLGLPETYVTVHDLRRSFSAVARETVGGEMNSRLLNHISGLPGSIVTKRHYSPKELAETFRKPLQKVADAIMPLATAAHPTPAPKRVKKSKSN